ncbi:MAG: Superoxide dismutase (Fe) [Candidatus Nomurabacteria bacterium GW2011_GWF2_35_66]|uniref:Superoxide dismutase n=1 Tax=Candidatus Nomurabacteria bacterium GW2011_GWE1_35_16 TaxID=1618761 RepID=A0A0G0EFE9_9BACT|nr:MAG: Superoxide dismutase (Fe) [Candidatus Nomurabacteria bacterium GW2011_GWF1_34_20]KKP62111.1 MAG: Superoxide dismutase (Fe) [Candidatus Nomurabacteria bacterium GW2011_GWE2_34_25]KKP66077.1 MAG: Superoxide dismutase (Fe) [Candidatus Nomurabacteria bacterium GW2011_GWE1_35_16]KKP83017.1 MAG: Superoxide dismutase (Fe) [Candidatus Nomurabacteria bacterium GW2011_GWF2_35_66]HAE36986.1 superoxide dismutase [Candidatus Nomurabacteria bacterium]
METFTTKTFNIPKLVGISEKTIEEHRKLYKGYVTNTNTIFNKLYELKNDPEKNAFILGELQRRLGFEFGGMRNHEYYFSSLSDGSKEINKEGSLYKSLEKEWGSFENFLNHFKFVALTRGIGWAMLYYDKSSDKLIISWVDEQHLGHLAGTSIVLALDMWEHSYYLDYTPAEKKKYIESFFANLNWSIIEQNFKNAS